MEKKQVFKGKTVFKHVAVSSEEFEGFMKFYEECKAIMEDRFRKVRIGTLLSLLLSECGDKFKEGLVDDLKGRE